MSFDLEELFVDVFAPQYGDVALIMVDLPHDALDDTPAWQARRDMARDWHDRLQGFAHDYGVRVLPLATYLATGSHNADLPAEASLDGEQTTFDEVLSDVTIVMAMTQFSASAPLIAYTHKYDQLRVASMPTVTPAMQETALSADYAKIAEVCSQLAPFFEKGIAVEVTFSTGHKCTFDISDKDQALKDDGRLHPGVTSDALRVRNLPSGEVAVTPREDAQSKTAGEIPVALKEEVAIFKVQRNRIFDVHGESQEAGELRASFREEPARANIAEVAIGCNDKAVVSGNIIEDEKAGFHWAYGRSEHIGGTVGPDDFSSPDRVVHQDIIYARDSQIVCQKLDFVFAGGARHTVIVDGELQLPE